MLYYVSMADDDTGGFLGAAFVNASCQENAVRDAGALLPPESPSSVVQMLITAVPAGGPAIPAIGRLLTRADIEAMEPTVTLAVDGEGAIKRVPD